MSRVLKWLGLTLAALVAMVALIAGVARFSHGPIGPFPGGALEGRAEPAPADWSFAEQTSNIAIEVDPENPRSVTAGLVIYEKRPYVAATWAARKTWPHIAERDPRVRVRVEGRIFELNAVRVDDPALHSALARLIGEKYGATGGSLAADSGTWIFRLDPRERGASGA